MKDFNDNVRLDTSLRYIMINKLYKIVCDLANNRIILNDNGIFDKNNINKNSFEKNEIVNDVNLILEAIKIIPCLIKKSSLKIDDSYRLKHLIEPKLSDKYISNGLMILSMLYLKYN